MSEMCVSAIARSALQRGIAVVLAHDAHATYDIPGRQPTIMSSPRRPGSSWQRSGRSAGSHAGPGPEATESGRFDFVMRAFGSNGLGLNDFLMALYRGLPDWSQLTETERALVRLATELDHQTTPAGHRPAGHRLGAPAPEGELICPAARPEHSASLRELMERMGHASSRAALIYLHSTHDRQRTLAEALSQRALRDRAGESCGTRRTN